MLTITFPPKKRSKAPDASLKSAILSLVTKRGGVSFAEVQRLPGAAGDHNLSSERNLVYWAGLSDEACRAVLELRAEGLIYFHPCEVLVYLVDGEVLTLPVVKSPTAAERGYKTLHWLPVVLNPGPHPNAARLALRG